MAEMANAKIEKLCDRIADQIHQSEDLDGMAFLDSLVEVDKCCNEILEDEERALQSERFKSLVIYKCRLFDRKKDQLMGEWLFFRKQCETLLESDNDFENVKSEYYQYKEMEGQLQEILNQFRDYGNSDNRTLICIADRIERERKFYLENGFSDEEFATFYRIKDYNRGKYTVHFNMHNYNKLSIDQLYKELEEEKEELEELEEELEELEDLDEDDYEEYDFESEEEYNERLEELDDDIYFCKCTIGLIEKLLQERINKQ